MTDNDPRSLDKQRMDYVSAAAKAVLGAIPFAGPLLSELVGNVIPNQRIERLIKYTKILDEKLSHLPEEIISHMLKDESFADLLEESLRQASRSLSEERRNYLASLIANSLGTEDIQYNESRHLLRILGEINDIEIIWLSFFAIYRSQDIPDDFRDKHEAILKPVYAEMGSPLAERDKGALQESYKKHLAQLGLLEPKYRVDSETHLPIFDSLSGQPENFGYDITALGLLLLRQIGIIHESNES